MSLHSSTPVALAQATRNEHERHFSPPTGLARDGNKVPLYAFGERFYRKAEALDVLTQDGTSRELAASRLHSAVLRGRARAVTVHNKAWLYRAADVDGLTRSDGW